MTSIIVTIIAIVALVAMREYYNQWRLDSKRLQRILGRDDIEIMLRDKSGRMKADLNTRQDIDCIMDHPHNPSSREDLEW